MKAQILVNILLVGAGVFPAGASAYAVKRAPQSTDDFVSPPPPLTCRMDAVGFDTNTAREAVNKLVETSPDVLELPGTSCAEAMAEGPSGKYTAKYCGGDQGGCPGLPKADIPGSFNKIMETCAEAGGAGFYRIGRCGWTAILSFERAPPPPPTPTSASWLDNVVNNAFIEAFKSAWASATPQPQRI